MLNHLLTKVSYGIEIALSILSMFQLPAFKHLIPSIADSPCPQIFSILKLLNDLWR